MSFVFDTISSNEIGICRVVASGQGNNFVSAHSRHTSGSDKCEQLYALKEIFMSE